jgi:hypothetical protein
MKILEKLKSDFPIFKIDINESGHILLDNKNTNIKCTKIEDDFPESLLRELEDELYKCVYYSIEAYIKNRIKDKK